MPSPVNRDYNTRSVVASRRPTLPHARAAPGGSGRRWAIYQQWLIKLSRAGILNKVIDTCRKADANRGVRKPTDYQQRLITLSKGGGAGRQKSRRAPGAPRRVGPSVGRCGWETGQTVAMRRGMMT